MVNEKSKIREIADSIINFTFEYDIDKALASLKLKPVPAEELKRLSSEERLDNFKKGIFKIKNADGTFVDINSLNEYCKKNKIAHPVIQMSPVQNYYRYEFSEDFTQIQVRKQIRHKLIDSSLDLGLFKKALISEQLKNKEVDGFIHGIGVKTSSLVSEGKFYIDSSCDREHALDLIFKEIKEIEEEEKEFITQKIRKNNRNFMLYVIFLFIIISLWVVNNLFDSVPACISNIVALVLFILLTIGMRFINHTEMKLFFSKQNAEKKFRSDFYEKQKDEIRKPNT